MARTGEATDFFRTEGSSIFYEEMRLNDIWSPARRIINRLMYLEDDLGDEDMDGVFRGERFIPILWNLYIRCVMRAQGFSITSSDDERSLSAERSGHSITIITDSAADENPAIQALSIRNMTDRQIESEYGRLFMESALSRAVIPSDTEEHLILAFSDFHDQNKVEWHHEALLRYLYEEDGFFSRPENVRFSAVLSSGPGVMGKFNRKGITAGCNPNIKGLRCTMTYPAGEMQDDRTPENRMLQIAARKSFETWTDGISIYLNPNAESPLNRNTLKEAAVFWQEDGKVRGIIPERFALTSKTFFMDIRDAEGASGPRNH